VANVAATLAPLPLIACEYTSSVIVTLAITGAATTTHAARPGARRVALVDLRANQTATARPLVTVAVSDERH
jgi:hypothetical protein